MTRLEDWAVAPPLHETAPENWEPKIVKMTRLERTEKLIAQHRPNWGAIPLDYCDYAYVIDCYKARVAVLEDILSITRKVFKENAIRRGNKSSLIVSKQLAMALSLTPEECLERTVKESLLVGEVG